ncbi:hypothetical protein X760_11905 [Mesorhizobium sp. LSHC422A00]|nr:hypothetical protein X760_11905 [Mesorhizobium sp. LSHC422A00]
MVVSLVWLEAMPGRSIADERLASRNARRETVETVFMLMFPM